MTPKPASPGDSAYAFRSDAYAWYVVFVLCLCSVVAYIDRGILNLLVEPIKRDLGASDPDIALLQGLAFVLFYGVLGVPLGMLADRWHRVRLIFVGSIIWTAATVLSGLAGSFATLFAARTLIGVGEATLTPSGYSMLADYFPRGMLGRAISIFTGSGFAGSGLALIAGSQLLAAAGTSDRVVPVLGTLHPWQLAFLLASLPGVLLLAILATVREPPRHSVGRVAAAALPRLGDVFRFLGANLRAVGSLYVGLSLLAAAQFALGGWTAVFFIRVYGWSASRIGDWYGAYFFTFGVAGVVAGGWIADWLARRGRIDSNVLTAIGAGCCAAPFALTFPLTGDPWASLALMAPLAFFAAMPFGAGSAAIPAVAPNRLRAQLVAVYLICGNLIGQAFGPWALAEVTENVLGGPAEVGHSIAIVVPLFMLAGVGVLLFGIAAVRAKMTDILADERLAPSYRPIPPVETQA